LKAGVSVLLLIGVPPTDTIFTHTATVPATAHSGLLQLMSKFSECYDSGRKEYNHHTAVLIRAAAMSPVNGCFGSAIALHFQQSWGSRLGCGSCLLPATRGDCPCRL